MLLRMPSPMKRKGSDNWYFRRTIPADVKRILAKLPRGKRPPNWYKTHIAVSLGTADRAIAKAKCPEVAAEVERHIQALRDGPKALTVKQIAALSGEVYRAFAEGLEDNPVLTPDQWRSIAAGARDARKGNPLLIAADDAERREKTLKLRFGRIADAILNKHALNTDSDSRYALIERLSIDLPAAAEKLARNADSDFSPDDYSRRFPLFETERASVPAPSGHSLRDLAEDWRLAAIARGVTERDAKRMSRVVLRFADWLGHDDANRVERADIVRWTTERTKEGISAATINKTDTAALRTIFEHGVDSGGMSANPLARNVRIKGRRKQKTRDEFFSDEEASAILTAALAVHASKREHSKTTAAKRWVPWLCAYSGARVVEMIQIRKEDVRQVHGTWVIRLTPEAGGIKTNEFRDVPIHEHLVALGFLEFVKSAPTGHLFCEVGKNGNVAGPAEGVYSRIRNAARAVVKDTNVQPNHAWRYTFKTRGLEAGLESIVLDAICGHAARTKGEDYTKVTLKKRAEAMKRFPRYVLGID